jgi:hypothetical protein
MDRRRDGPYQSHRYQSHQGENHQRRAARLLRYGIEVSRRLLVKLHGCQSF